MMFRVVAVEVETLADSRDVHHAVIAFAPLSLKDVAEQGRTTA
ncbi:MAG: hypothetical protein ACYDGN_06830 [Acidimicrobiales bacterium]